MPPEEFKSWLRKPPGERRKLVMGVLNVTPDSFSDAGRFATHEAAVARARQIAIEGADLIDIGGESTRPGSLPVPAEEQIRRVIPVIEAVRAESAITLSIDTTQAKVAAAAHDAGADIVNDISGGRDDAELLPLVGRRGVAVILMHMQGTPATMQRSPAYQDVIAEIKIFLRDRVNSAQTAGIDPADVLLDPGIGFGKAMDHNLQLLRGLKELTEISRPLVLGTSRKGFIGKITGESDPANRIMGTAATVAWTLANGADIVRVHDVERIVRVVRMIEAIQSAK